MQTSSNPASANSGSMLAGISETHSGSEIEDITSEPILTWNQAEAKGRELVTQLNNALLGRSSDKPASRIRELKGNCVIKNAGTRWGSENANLNRIFSSLQFQPRANLISLYTAVRRVPPDEPEKASVYQNAIDRDG